MSTPATQAHLAEADGGRDGGPGIGAARKAGGAGNARLNFAMFSIGAVAVIGLLVIFFGLYVAKPENIVIITIGMGILLIATIAWAVAAALVVGHSIREIVMARGRKTRKSRAAQG